MVQAATVMTKAVPVQTGLALHSCFQSNNVGKTFSKDDSLYPNNGTDGGRRAQVPGRSQRRVEANLGVTANSHNQAQVR